MNSVGSEIKVALVLDVVGLSRNFLKAKLNDTLNNMVVEDENQQIREVA